MWRSIIFNRKAQDWALVGLAVALFLSPWFFGFAARSSAWIAWFSSLFIAYLGFAATFSRGEDWEEWLCAALGAGLLFGPETVGQPFGIAATTTFWGIGAMTMAISLWAVWLNRRPADE